MCPADQMHINTGDLNSLKYWGLEVTQKLKIIIHMLWTGIHKDTGDLNTYKLLGLMEELQTCGWWIRKFTVTKFEITIHGSVKLISSESVDSFDKGHCLCPIRPFRLEAKVQNRRFRSFDQVGFNLGESCVKINNKQRQFNNWNWYEIQSRSLDQYDFKLRYLLLDFKT